MQLFFNAFSLFFDIDCSFVGPLEGPCSGPHRYTGDMWDALNLATLLTPNLRYRNPAGKDDKQSDSLIGVLSRSLPGSLDGCRVRDSSRRGCDHDRSSAPVRLRISVHTETTDGAP